MVSPLREPAIPRTLYQHTMLRSAVVSPRQNFPVRLVFALLFCLLDGLEPAIAQNVAPLRQIATPHLVLTTDTPPDPEIDELPHVFEAALPLWAEFFRVPMSDLESWKIRAYLMHDVSRFKQAGLMPEDLPEFLHGYQRDDEIWVREQPSPYYRRHLFLHEGTHAVMWKIFRRSPPPWYNEGIAEMLGTHRWTDGKLTLGILPPSKEESPYWGRIALVRQSRFPDLQANPQTTPDVPPTKPPFPSLFQSLDYRPRHFLQVDAYAWSWAFATFCQHHPLVHDRFQALQSSLDQQNLEGNGERHGLSETFVASVSSIQPSMLVAWELFLHHLDYGYRVDAEAVTYSGLKRWDQGQPVADFTVSLRTDASWQSTGLIVPASREVRISATGRYQVGEQIESEANGVTLGFYQGLPRGMLLGALLPAAWLDPETGIPNPKFLPGGWTSKRPGTPEDTSNWPPPVDYRPQAPAFQFTLPRSTGNPSSNFAISKPSGWGLTDPWPLGAEGTFRAASDAVLFLRVNERADALSDNQGTLQITLQPLLPQPIPRTASPKLR